MRRGDLSCRMDGLKALSVISSQPQRRGGAGRLRDSFGKGAVGCGGRVGALHPHWGSQHAYFHVVTLPPPSSPSSTVAFVAQSRRVHSLTKKRVGGAGMGSQ